MNDDQMWDSICIGYKGNMSDYDNNPYTVKKSEILCDETTKDIKGPWFSFSHTDNPRELLFLIRRRRRAMGNYSYSSLLEIELYITH